MCVCTCGQCSAVQRYVCTCAQVQLRTHGCVMQIHLTYCAFAVHILVDLLGWLPVGVSVVGCLSYVHALFAVENVAL